MINSKIDELIEKIKNYENTDIYDDILQILYEVRPIIENMSNTIYENTNKIPLAQKKLSYVTEVTENATSDILAVVETMFDRVDKITALISNTFDVNKYLNEMQDFLNKIKEGDSVNYKTEIENYINKLNTDRNQLDNYNEHLIKSKVILNSLYDDLTSIMMVLQIQDITAQHIASTNHLLNNMKIRLTHLINEYNASELSDLISHTIDYQSNANVSKLHREIGFNDSDDNLEFDSDSDDIINSIISDYESELNENEDKDYAKELELLLEKSELEFSKP